MSSSMTPPSVPTPVNLPSESQGILAAIVVVPVVLVCVILLTVLIMMVAHKRYTTKMSV